MQLTGYLSAPGRAWPAVMARAAAAPLAFAALTGLLAGVRVPLPFTPVPLTGQVFGVLLAGLCLRGGPAAASQVLYLALGLAGIPWFSGWSAAGAATFFAGPTGGYLAGFVPAAWLVAVLARRGRGARGAFTAAAAGVALIHLCGALRLSRLLGLGAAETMALAVYPFLFFDLLKASLAASIAGWPPLERFRVRLRGG